MTAGRPPRRHVAGYDGRIAVLGTRHGKEHVIGPALAAVGLSVVVEPLDTDQFGTFTGEIERLADPITTCGAKARAAMAAAGSPLGLASEGSFYPHPDAFGVTVDAETLVLVDDDNGLVIVETVTSLDTPASRITVHPGEDLSSFLASIGFPAQAVIVRPLSGPPVVKGITDVDLLAAAVTAAAAHDGSAVVETDLRAHQSPARRLVIAAAARRLASRLTTHCASCQTPGFGRRTLVPGLPCADCSTPTREIRCTRLACVACDHVEEIATAGFAAPRWCPFCNP